jgi:glycosyltransferase involved in cell wall biosynthesis
MKAAFFSNFLNHHQLPLCLAMCRKLGIENFRFIATTPVPMERLAMGYSNMNHSYPFVIESYCGTKEKTEAWRWCAESDLIIWGSAPIDYFLHGIKKNKLVFQYSEHLDKPAIRGKFSLCRRASTLYHLSRCVQKNVYLLCASAYAAHDYFKCGLYWGKTYKWGYFPDVKRYDDIESVLNRKSPITILWVARLIELKHPEASIMVAKRLSEEGYSFELNMIGNGIMDGKLLLMIKDFGLQEKVHLLGAMSPEKVREYMERAGIFLFTSDINEGWGTVMNESMNSGCAVIASHTIGSVPFMIRDGVNGLIYEDGNIDYLYGRVKWLIENPEKQRELGRCAYDTLVKQWNAENAVERLLLLSNALLSGKRHPDLFSDGVCSKASIITRKWMNGIRMEGII